MAKTKVKAKSVKVQTAKPKAVKAKVAKPKAVKAKVAKPKAVKAKVAKPKAVKAKVAKPKAVKAKVAKPKAVKAKVQGTKPNAVKAKVQATKPNAVKAKVAKPKAVKVQEVKVKEIMSKEEKTKYSDKELAEFRKIINKKLDEARKELTSMQNTLTNSNDHGTDDTGGSFKMLEDGSDSLAKEELSTMAIRQKKFIEQLENALIRIENKTYGICRVTGKLIPAERLRAVPHTTQSIEAKNKQYKD